jgi:uncharacterized BrkB/YihY/UPF0761 family membrane protein
MAEADDQVPDESPSAQEQTTGVGALIADVFDGWDRHNGAQMSGSVAFFMALSAAPLLIVVAAASVLILGRQVVSGQLVTHLSPVIGLQATRGLQGAVRATIESTKNGTFAIIAAVVGTVFGAAGAVIQLRTSLNVILGRDAVSALRAAANDWFTAVLAVFVIATAGVVMLTSWVATAAVEVLPGGPLQAPAQALITIALYYGLVTLAYLRLPARRLPRGASLIGSGIATLFAVVASVGIMVFLGTGFASTVYGTAASFFLFLMWLWLVATGFIIGAESARALAKRERPLGAQTD